MLKYLTLVAVTAFVVSEITVKFVKAFEINAISLELKTPAKEIEEIHTEFIRDIKNTHYGKKYNNKTVIKFAEFNSNVIARCFSGSVSKEVFLSKKHWDQASKISKKALLYHELTHCVCNKMHIFKSIKEMEDNGFFDKLFYKVDLTSIKKPFVDGCSSSLMAPKEEDDLCYSTHWNQYVTDIQDLCNKVSLPL